MGMQWWFYCIEMRGEILVEYLESLVTYLCEHFVVSSSDVASSRQNPVLSKKAVLCVLDRLPRKFCSSLRRF